MKVLWFSNTPALGNDYLNKDSKIKGTGGWMYALNEEIKEKVDLSIVFHHPYKKEKFKYKDTCFYPVYTGNIIVENLKKRFLDKVYDEHFLVQYMQIIEEVKPDIIHIHGTENSFLCVLGRTKIPVVISIQGNLTVYEHKFFVGFHGRYLKDKYEQRTFKSILFGRNTFGRGYKTMGAMAKVEQQHLKSALHIIGRTDWDRRVAGILAPKSNYYIGNEILRDGFYENQWNNNYEEGKIIIFTTNSNNYYKGFETVCYTVSLLNNLGLEVEWRVAGIFEDSLITEITKKYLGNKYPIKGLILLGSLEESELIRNLQESHIYSMASHIENSPNNLCEAMILGMPCIATFAGGTGTILKDGEEGILIQDGDPWAMAGAIIELMKMPELAGSYAKKARRTALKRHNKETIITRLLETYSEIIKVNHEH